MTCVGSITLCVALTVCAGVFFQADQSVRLQTYLLRNQGIEKWRWEGGNWEGGGGSGREGGASGAGEGEKGGGVGGYE